MKYLPKNRPVHIYPNMYCEKCKVKLRLRDNFELREHMEKVHRIFRCDWPHCEFGAESKHERSIHIKEIHRKKNKESQ